MKSKRSTKAHTIQTRYRDKAGYRHTRTKTKTAGQYKRHQRTARGIQIWRDPVGESRGFLRG